MLMNIRDDITRLDRAGLLDGLLADRTTGGRLLWGTDALSDRGEGFQREDELRPSRLTGVWEGSVETRARRDFEGQSGPLPVHADPFTPTAVVRDMVDRLDADWVGRREGYYKIDIDSGKIYFPKRRNWRQYADSRRIEIACGEAPFLAGRYDAVSGETVPLDRRTAILDRKLRGVSENAAHEQEWMEWARRAFLSVYGYEYRGDRLLIARVNLLASYGEYFRERWGKPPDPEAEREIAEIITWNLWQMDGLTERIPGLLEPEAFHQISLDEYLDGDIRRRDPRPPCRIRNWKNGRTLEYRALRLGGEVESMAFAYAIGTPPCQDRTSGRGGVRPESIGGADIMNERIEKLEAATGYVHQAE